MKVDDFQTEMSNILARDSRTNVNVSAPSDLGMIPAVFAVEMLTEMKVLSIDYCQNFN